jgi:hypothetical protein
MFEEEYNNLLRLYNRLQNSYEELKEKHEILQAKYEQLEHRISYELEPRLVIERKGYDSFIINGGSDICFKNGMNGTCGEDCELFGTKDECK